MCGVPVVIESIAALDSTTTTTYNVPNHTERVLFFFSRQFKKCIRLRSVRFRRRQNAASSPAFADSRIRRRSPIVDPSFFFFFFFLFILAKSTCGVNVETSIDNQL